MGSSNSYSGESLPSNRKDLVVISKDKNSLTNNMSHQSRLKKEKIKLKSNVEA